MGEMDPCGRFHYAGQGFLIPLGLCWCKYPHVFPPAGVCLNLAAIIYWYWSWYSDFMAKICNSAQTIYTIHSVPLHWGDGVLFAPTIKDWFSSFSDRHLVSLRAVSLFHIISVKRCLTPDIDIALWETCKQWVISDTTYIIHLKFRQTYITRIFILIFCLVLE